MRPSLISWPPFKKAHFGAQHLGLPQIVGGQEHGDPGLPVEPENLLPDMLGHLLVQARGGFVQEEQFRVVDQGLGQGETLLEAGGEPLEGDRPVFRQPEQVQELFHLVRQGPASQAVKPPVEPEAVFRPSCTRGNGRRWPPG